MTPQQLDHLYKHSTDAKQALAKIQAALNKPHRTLIGLTGGPGSGKSTFAEYVTSYFFKQQKENVINLSMDGFHLSKAQLKALPNSEAAFARRGAPWTFDSSAFADRIKQIHQSYQQENILWPSFDHSLGDPIEDDICIEKGAKVILIEGLYLLQEQNGWKEAAVLFDEHWFLDIPLEVSIERLAQRHMKAWGISKTQAMERINKSDSINAELVHSTKNGADWLLKNS